MEVNNKVSIVTGGVGGIGFSTVQHLLRNGAEYVAIFDAYKLDNEVVTDCLKKLEREFQREKYGYYTCNLLKDDDFKANYGKVLEVKKYVDILVNNAGVACDVSVDMEIDVNFKSVVKCTLHAIEHMGKHKNNRGGVVVNIGSFLGLINKSTSPLYNATKHAVVSFVRSMKENNSRLGVRIVCICPGMTKTNMIDVDNLYRSTFDFVDKSKIDEILKIYTQSPDNVARAVVEIIERGKEGDVWLAQNDEPAFAVGEETVLENMRIPF